ncbi:MAG: GAF domain-containing protein [Anaerolineales bacterium]
MIPKASPLDRLFERWQDKYILRIQVLAQQIALVSTLPAILYIWLNVHLSRLQVAHLVFSTLFSMLFANFLLASYTAFASSRARKRLYELGRGITASPQPADEEAAWLDAVRLPWRVMPAAFLTLCAPVALSVAVYMNNVVEIAQDQTVHLLIASLIFAIGFSMQNTMMLDRTLAPVRNALLPASREKQTISGGVSLQNRLQITVAMILLINILMIAPLAYEKLRQTVAASAQTEVLSNFILQVSLVSGVGLLITLGVATLQAVIIASPIKNIIEVMREIEQGHLSRRAALASSDETAELTLRLNQMLDQLQIAQTDLEKRVAERTAELSRRAVMLQAATSVARQAVASQDLNVLLNETVNLISERFNYYHTGIFLLDERGEYAILYAASSEGGKRMLERGHRLAVGRQGIVGNAAYFNRARIATNVGEDAVFFDNPDLPATRSEAALPLSVRGRVIGVLDIQSVEINAFPPETIELLQAMADQIALAIQNARLLTESQEAVQRLQALTSEGVRKAWRERIGQQRRAYRYTPLGTAAYTPAEDQEDHQAPNRLEVPITLRNQKIGSLVFRRRDNTPWPEAERLLAAEVANQVALAIENVRLLELAQYRAAQEQALSELTAHLSQSLDPDTIMQIAVRELRQLPSVTEVSVYLNPPQIKAPKTPSA